MQNTDAIVHYMKYLREKAGLMISVHFLIKPKAYALDELYAFARHSHPYCAYIGQTAEAHWKCLECQRKAASKCRKHGAFSGVCHAGVFEYVYPIVLEGKTEGVLCVSGYAAPDGEDYIENLCEKYELNRTMLQATYAMLRTNVPEKQEIDTLIYPLLSMMELFSYKQKTKGIPNRTLSQKIIEYCTNQYLQKITSETLCQKFFCSRSYIAHMFKKETGKSLPEYLNHLRIQTAKQILESSDVHMSEVASLSGFEERRRFSKCFKKETGYTPREWRKLKKNAQ